MAANIRIQCTNKTLKLNPHERIDSIGGVNGDGTRWTMTQAAAILCIERREYTFYVNIPARSLEVIVASHVGVKYLKTKTDHLQPEGLLSLLDCP